MDVTSNGSIFSFQSPIPSGPEREAHDNPIRLCSSLAVRPKNNRKRYKCIYKADEFRSHKARGSTDRFCGVAELH